MLLKNFMQMQHIIIIICYSYQSPSRDVWSIMHDCIIHTSLLGLCDCFVATHQASYMYIATTSVCSSGKPTGQYHIYTTARYFDLRHRWATILYYIVFQLVTAIIMHMGNTMYVQLSYCCYINIAWSMLLVVQM